MTIEVRTLRNMPMFSVITPSLNCGAYIRDCIESVLAQDYENFEHIVVDGGSTDDTLRTLRTYPHVKWISETDRGEADALNKALRRVRGDIIGWLNADDYYLPGVFHRVVQELDPSRNRHAVYGNTHIIDDHGNFLYEKRSAPIITLPLLVRWWENHRMPHQPSTFYSRELIANIGPFNSTLHFSIDYEYWLRIILKYRFNYVDQLLAHARQRTNSKSFDTVPSQIRSHWKVSLPYYRHLTSREQVSICWDYWHDYEFPIVVNAIHNGGLSTELRGTAVTFFRMLEAR